MKSSDYNVRTMRSTHKSAALHLFEGRKLKSFNRNSQLSGLGDMVGPRVQCREEEQEEGEEYGLEENSRRADGQGADRDKEDKHSRIAKRIALDILAQRQHQIRISSLLSVSLLVFGSSLAVLPACGRYFGASTSDAMIA